MYFFYLSRLHYLEPDRDMPFFCLVIKQRNFPPILFLLLLALTSFNVPISVTVAYLLVVIEDHFFKGRYFTFNFYYYLKGERILKCFSNRDDFYKVEECGDSLSFFNNINDLRRLYRQAEDLLRNIRLRNPNPADDIANAPAQDGMNMAQNQNHNEHPNDNRNQEQ